LKAGDNTNAFFVFGLTGFQYDNHRTVSDPAFQYSNIPILTVETNGSPRNMIERAK